MQIICDEIFHQAALTGNRGITVSAVESAAMSDAVVRDKNLSISVAVNWKLICAAILSVWLTGSRVTVTGGVSGAIPYFSSTTTESVSAACFAACIEGLFFFAAFAYVYFLRSKGLLKGLAAGTNWVFRDVRTGPRQFHGPERNPGALGLCFD